MNTEKVEKSSFEDLSSPPTRFYVSWQKNMLYGAGLLIFGGMISAASYSIASNGANGGRYVITTGIMIVGGIQFAFGVFEFCLTELLSGDVLAEIREAKESNATKLCLHYRKIADLMPLAELSNLRNLDLDDNPIPYEQKVVLKKALPNCKIEFD